MAIWDALVEGGVKSVILAGVGVLVVLCVCCVCCCKICRRKNGGLEDEDILVRESFNSGLLGNGSWQTNSHIGQLVSMIYPNHGSLQRLGMLDFNMLSVDEAAGPFAAGGGGVLYKGTFLNKRVAIKALHSQMFEASDLEEISHEAALLVRVAHENIVKLYGVAHHQGVLYLVTDYVPHTLQSVVEREEFTPADLLWFMRQVIRATAFMHSRGVAHRDLKPENILLTAEGDVRICDLGIASLVRSSSCHPQRVGVDALPMSLVIGSPPWSPPEASAGHLAPADDGDTLSPLHTQEENEDAGVDRFSPANAASHNHHTTGISVFDSAWDVFSLAMLTWYLWYGERPFDECKSLRDMLRRLHRGERPPLSAAPVMPDPLSKLVQHMWRQQPLSRLRMDEVLYRLDGEVARALTQRHFASFKGKASFAAADAVASSDTNPGARFRLWRMQRACGKRWRWAVGEVLGKNFGNELSTSISGSKSLSTISSNDSGKSLSSMGGDDEVSSSDEHLNFRHERMGSADVKSSSIPGASLFDPPMSKVTQLTASGPGAPSTRFRRNTAVPGSSRPLSFKLLVGVAENSPQGESEDGSNLSTITSPLLQRGGDSPLQRKSPEKKKKNVVRRVKSEYNPPQLVHMMSESDDQTSESDDSTSERSNMRSESLGRSVQRVDSLLLHENSKAVEVKTLRVLIEGFLDRKSTMDPTTSRGSATGSADANGAERTIKWKRRYCTVVWDDVVMDWRLVYFHAGFLPSHVFQEPPVMDGSSDTFGNNTTTAINSSGTTTDGSNASGSGGMPSELWSLYLRQNVTAVRLLGDGEVAQDEAPATADAEALSACFVVDLAPSSSSNSSKGDNYEESIGGQDNSVAAASAAVQQRVFRAETPDDALRWVNALQSSLNLDSTPRDLLNHVPNPSSRQLDASPNVDVSATRSPLLSPLSISEEGTPADRGNHGPEAGVSNRSAEGASTSTQYESSVILSREDWI